MNRVQTYTALEEIASADLNAWQDNTFGLAQASGCFVGARPYLYSDGATNITVGPFAGLPIGTAGFLTQASSVPLSMSGLTSSTWYYVYVHNNAGSPAYEFSTTAPTDDLTFKTSDTSRVYIGCFRALTSSTCFGFRMANRRYTYRNYTSGHDVITSSGAGAISLTSLSSSTVLINAPPHANFVELQSSFVHTGAANIAFYVTGDSNASKVFSLDANTKSIVIFDQELSGSQFDYAASDSGAWAVKIVGFTEG